MVRWRLCLFLALLLIFPEQASSKGNDDDDEETESEPKRRGVKRRKSFPSSHVEEGEEEENDEDNDDDEEDSPPVQKFERPSMGRRAPATLASATPSMEVITRTVPRRPLECFVCAYKAESQLRSCLDPTKYRVHTMICHSAEDKCFTSVISKGNTYEAVMRGCRSGCVSSPETTCCDLNRCNNQALAVPLPQPHALVQSQKYKKNKCNKTIPPSVLFFVTILLVLQTVVKVAFV